jgi:hypothetical protein
MQCHAIPCTLRAARLCARAACRDLSSRAFLPGSPVLVPFSVWQAEEAVANLPLRLAVRVRCGHQAWRGRVGH